MAATSPGRCLFAQSLDRYLDSMRAIYDALPDDWRVFLEHKLYEPAFYSTVINDWGMSYYCARELGPQAFCLVDLGHHAPNVNIEMIVARLIQFGKLGGFHFNDSKYGDDDLDAGSIKPFQLFLIFNELVDAELNEPGFAPAYMLDQSHNVTDPARVADDERRRGGARLRAGPSGGSPRAHRGTAAVRCDHRAFVPEAGISHRRLAAPRHGPVPAPAARSIRWRPIAPAGIASKKPGNVPLRHPPLPASSDR